MMLTKLNEAISLIDNRYLDMVDSEEKEIINMSNTHKTKTVRKRVFTALIAAVLLAFGCFTTAFALNEDFRATVLSFFKIHSEDKVEQVPVENEPLHLETEGISGQIETSATVSRVCVPNNGFAADGLFYVCTDKNEYNSGGKYDIYDMANGELTILKKNEYCAVCQIDGRDYPLQLEWAENGSSIGISFVGGPELTDGSSTEGSYTVCQTYYSDGPKALLLLETNSSIRVVIANLASNTAYPISLNKGYSQLGNICTAEISENGSTLLLQTTEPNKKYYGVDIGTGKVVCLNDLCSSELSGCRFASDRQLLCWSVSSGVSAEEMELILAQQASGQESAVTVHDFGTISAWMVTPETETSKQVLADKPATVYTNSDIITLGVEDSKSDNAGIVCISGRYAVETENDGSLAVYDFIENSQTISDNLTLPDTDSLDLLISPDGSKLLFVERKIDDGALVRISVLDMAENCFIAIDRDPSAVGNEHLADWFDSETVLVDNNTYDASGNNTGDSWCYLYRVSN